ncbi:hypothetical protein [Mycetocola zhadangensis]|uniref:Uncharacterized protein n=1 Tax=Mycetocola zhadangensis TaxID=1164595 RepID=A0A3L7J4H1_9MICO|nr:hypothetical protein [Mycetocola zhadangensis]RLQ85370.1 hypothetical protein D9V28_00280 [Mycetocola zhadangensis]GGE82008.1 hypothetical protein GCM10011313_00550 [Mycetocola zhadangensis]
MTRKVILTGADLSLILPGSWAVVPLTDRDAAQARITALIKKQMGKNDRLASVRRELKTSLVQAAEEAITFGAVGLAISLEILPGVPFPASLIIIPVNWPSAFENDDSTQTERLLATYPGATLIDEESDRPIVRRHEVVTTTYETETSTDLRINYWLPAGDGSRLARVHIKAPMAHTPALWLELFDAIVGSLGWLNRASLEDEGAKVV